MTRPRDPRRAGHGVVLVVSLLAAVPSVADEAGKALPDGFGWLADVAGYCWNGTFPDGVRRHTHCYTTQFDRFLRGTATLFEIRDGRELQAFSGDSLWAWDPDTRRIVYYTWASDGSHGRHEAWYDGDQLLFPMMSRTEPEVVVFRSAWRRVDADHIEVRRERPDGERWTTELTVLYTRSPFEALR